MQKAIFAALNGLCDGLGSPWFGSDEFGRIALNGGFELTVRDRLLEPLHTIVCKASPDDSIVSEYSKHGYNYQHLVKGVLKGKSLRADMARVTNLMKGPKCAGVIELKANFSSQKNDIKKRTEADYIKWFPSTGAAPPFPWHCLYIVVEVADKTAKTHANIPHGYFPKYPHHKNPPVTTILDIQKHFIDFVNPRNGRGLTLFSITDPSQTLPKPTISSPFKATCVYPSFVADIKTHFFLLEKRPLPLNTSTS